MNRTANCTVSSQPHDGQFLVSESDLSSNTIESGAGAMTTPVDENTLFAQTNRANGDHTKRLVLSRLCFRNWYACTQ